jgi:hypothetical protein
LQIEFCEGSSLGLVPQFFVPQFFVPQFFVPQFFVPQFFVGGPLPNPRQGLRLRERGNHSTAASCFSALFFYKIA